jgi:calcineurin-like phosphoesterase
MPAKFDVASGPARLCGVIVDVDEQSGLATDISRLSVDADLA